MNRATILNVASKAGVSRSTVSNVIGNPEIVAAETRQRVQGRCTGLMSRPAPPDAVIAASDRMAPGFLQRATERGLRVPEDVAVVGFNDMEFTQYVSPPLSTVRLPIAEMARAAVALVLRRIAGKSAGEAHGTVLPVRFIARRSAEPPSGPRLLAQRGEEL